ncbi:unnamed protein product [Durusdinium trenchii]|uniref:Uncharacterized protein n=2 Tax=Durusdinium trenchii TaxID=1381693 RepID=A0ABP0PKS6_9DINO
MMRGLRSVAVVCVLLGLWNAFTPPLKSGWSTARDQSLVARKADSSGLTPFGPVVTYAKALMEGGKSKGEEVAVTKDVLYIKLMYDSDEFKENLVAVLNNPKLKELEKAETMVKLMPGLKSSVMPKFITFLAKKNRLGGVKRIMLEFVQAMYFNNAITPVKVTSAQRLSDEQKDKIKEKMSSKVGTDIKLLEDVDPGLLGGFKLEWGYQDPDRLIAPSQGVDLSLKFILNKRALQKGVVDAL